MYWYSDNRSIQFNFNGKKVNGIGLSVDTGPALYFYQHFKMQTGLPVNKPIALLMWTFSKSVLKQWLETMRKP